MHTLHPFLDMASYKRTRNLTCLESYSSTKQEPPVGLTAQILDGAAMVQMTTSKSVKTYGEYSLTIFRERILKTLKEDSISRVDVIFDRYVKNSLKSETRKMRGRDVRRGFQ